MADGAVHREQQSGHTGLYLRVLAGANQGAALPLADGTWVIGSGPAADIAFAEPALADAHLTATIAGGHIRIAAGAGVLVGAEAMPAGGERELPTLLPLTIGRTVFAFGPPDADWGAIETPRPIEAEPPAANEAVPATAGRNNAPQGEPAVVVAVPPRRGLRGFRRLAAMLVVFVVLAGAAGALAAWVSFGSEPSAPSGPDPLSRARRVIAELRLADVKADLVKRRVIVSGRIRDQAAVDELSAALLRARIAAELRIRTDAALIEEARTVLRAYAIDAELAVDAAGRLAVSGYADDTAKLEEALERVRRDVPGVNEVDDRVVTPERARRRLEQAIQAAGLADALKLTTAPHVVTVTGMLDPARASRWQTVADDFRTTFGDRVRLSVRVVALSAAAPRGVRLGADSYIVLQDGRQLRVGDRLGSTGTITAIEARRVTVRTVNGDIALPFAQGPYWIMEDGK